MKLWYSKGSPVVRKVLTVANYHMLNDIIEFIEAKSFSNESSHNKVNPVGKIPVLQLDNGQSIIDSRVISEYFDSIGSEKSLFVSDKNKWHDLTIQAIADGMLENAIPVVAEKLFRKKGPDTNPWKERQEQLINRVEKSLLFLESNLDYLSKGELTIGKISAVCISEWSYLRKEEIGINLKDITPGLYNWFCEANKKYDSLNKTRPN